MGANEVIANDSLANLESILCFPRGDALPQGGSPTAGATAPYFDAVCFPLFRCHQPGCDPVPERLGRGPLGAARHEEANRATVADPSPQHAVAMTGVAGGPFAEDPLEVGSRRSG